MNAPRTALPEVQRITDFGRRTVKLCPPGAPPPPETMVIGPIDVEEGMLLQQTGNGYGAVEGSTDDDLDSFLDPIDNPSIHMLSVKSARRSEWIPQC